MKYLVFYASNHGFGHLTRTIAIIEKILKISDYNISLVSGKSQIDFAKLYLADYLNRIEFRVVNTDIGLVCNWNSLGVNREETLKGIDNYLGSLDGILQSEIEHYKDMDIHRIIVDISILGIYLGKALNIPSTLITNFTWCQQYEYLEFPQGIIDKYKNTYKMADSIIEYDLSLGLGEYGDNITPTGLLAREIDENRVEELKEKYGKILMISCGKSATLDNIHIRNFDGTIIKTRGIEVTSTSPVIELDLNILDTQNYVAASEAIIAKAGWGTLGEGMVGHTPMILMERPVREDSEMIETLKSRRLAVSINPRDMHDIDYLDLKKRIDEDIDRSALNRIENKVEEVARLIIN